MNWNSRDLAQVRCDICGTDNSSVMHTRPDKLVVVECRGCGLAYVNPRPAPELIVRLYDEDYFTGNRRLRGDGYLLDYFCESKKPDFERTALRYLHLIQRHVDLEGKSLLEVGCATGEFCALASEHCADVLGIDISSFVVEEACRRYPSLQFAPGTVSDLVSRKKTSYDVVCAFQVIEHVLSPKEFLAQIRTMMSARGVLFLSMPNYGLGKGMGLKNWIGTNTNFEHLWYFSADSIEKLGNACGFRAVAHYSKGIGTIPRPRPLVDGTKRVLKMLGLLDWARELKKLVRGDPAEYVPGCEGDSLLVVMRADQECRAAAGV